MTPPSSMCFSAPPSVHADDVVRGLEVAIRPASLHDWPQIAEVLLYYRMPVSGVCRKLDRFIVARIGDSFAGTAGLDLERAALRAIAVVPEWSGCGIGRQLARALLEHAQQFGLRQLSIGYTVHTPWLMRSGFMLAAEEE